MSKILTTDAETPLPSIVWAGVHSDIEQTSDGGGEYPDGFQLTQQGVQKVAAWLVERSSRDPYDCEACDVVEGACPVHYGAALGWEDLASLVTQAVKDAVETEAS